jgi:hypothetical protein
MAELDEINKISFIFILYIKNITLKVDINFIKEFLTPNAK